MTEIRPASKVEQATAEDLGLTEQQLQQRKIGKAIRTKRARERAVAKASGTDNGHGSPDLASKLEASSAKARDDAAKRFKAKQAVAAQLRKRTGGDAA